MFQQIININMQGKKSEITDYEMGFPSAKYNQFFNQNNTNLTQMQQKYQNFFMKYASSIIQVVKQEKLQKSYQCGTQRDLKSPIFDISEVKSYEMETLCKNSSQKSVQSNNYNNLGDGFKKKTNKKYTLAYNYTNITLFCSYVSKVHTILIKKIFNTLKITQNKPKFIKNQPPKSKSSFHSDYTACTANQDNGIKKLSNLYKQLKRSQETKQSINMMKGWIQFRLLITKSQCFKSVKFYASSRETQKKFIKFKENHNFPLPNDQSLFLINHEEQSLAYTADQNFQFSQKQITISTLQKPFINKKISNLTLNKQSKGKISQYATPNNHESIVQVYKLSQVHYTNFQQQQKLNVTQAHQIQLNNQRKIMNVRINTFQLPLISQFYLKDEQIPKQNQGPLKKDTFQQALKQVQTSNQQVINNFQSNKAILFKQTNSLKKSQLKQKINLVQNTAFKINLQSTKNVKMIQLNTQRSAEKLQIKLNQQKKEPHKIEDYYFPGIQSRIDKLIQTKSRIKIIKDQKNAYQTDRTTLGVDMQHESTSTKNIRIQESLVRDFPYQNQSKITKTLDDQRNLMIRSKQKKVTFNTPIQRRVQPLANVRLDSLQQRIVTSQQNQNIIIMDNFQMQRKPYFSPQSNLRPYQSPKVSQRISKPSIQQQYKQMRPQAKQIRHSKKDLEILAKQNNLYQINYQNQQNTVVGNLNNYYHTIDHRNTHIKTTKETHHSPNHKIVQQIMSNRPSSKIAPHSNQLPFKTENLCYGIQVRQTPRKKVSFHSPQTNRYNYPQMTYIHQGKSQQIFTSKRQDQNHEYFARENIISKTQEKAANFHNQYYNYGGNIPSRPNQILVRPTMIKPNLYSDSKSPQIFGSQRPHSSFRQSTERFNIFSNYSPMQSQIQNNFQRSKHFSSRNSSQIKRPKSMNQKIFIIVRGER